MRNLIFYFSLFLFTNSAFSQSADVQINPFVAWQGENSLTVNPTNPQNLVAAWMQASLNGVRVVASRSLDNGLTWSTPVVMPHFGTIQRTSADPTLAAASDGTIYLGYIDAKMNHDTGAVYVCKSMDGGLTWNTPSIVINGNYSADLPVDRPWLAVDNSGGIYNGRVYCDTKSVREATPPYKVYEMHSADGGQTWSSPLQVDATHIVGNIASMAVPTVAANGTLHVGYLSWDNAFSLWPQLIDAQSTDGGNTFTYHVMATSNASSGFPASDTLLQWSDHISANPLNANELCAIYSDHSLGDPDINFIHSLDGGLTWSNPIRLNDDATGNGAAQEMCWAGFSANGHYAALWRDRRNTGVGQTADYEIWGAFSADGGDTFLPNFKLSTSSGPLFIPVDGNDFLGVSVSDTTVCGTWADKRGTTNQVYCNCAHLSVPTSIATTELPNNELKCFPNPAGESVTIFAPINSNIKIYDAQGKLVEEIKMKENESIISTARYADGVYLIKSESSTISLIVKHSK